MEICARILGVDPSGNFHEGKGTTGIMSLDVATAQGTLHQVRAKNHTAPQLYWRNVWYAIQDQLIPDTLVVIEDYRLDPARAAQQSHSMMETPKLIGILEYLLYNNGIPYMLQPASAVKSRWTDTLLVRAEVLEVRNKKYYYNGLLTNDHMRDSIRHAWHVYRFKLWRKVHV